MLRQARLIRRDLLPGLRAKPPVTDDGTTGGLAERKRSPPTDGNTSTAPDFRSGPLSACAVDSGQFLVYCGETTVPRVGAHAHADGR